ncbi:sugar ABC transporter substrate-binding protein [Micromonospora sp. KC213]|uniref:ABC transporter substrate-binding protein n=1 Tax=Micromonospora sp. KC213 TaxID=2530378 RepID=UPI00104E7509|nr:sugar ABC transporter substrate-binding protein [Micromonospora sp. KC213]TDC42396.1 sugar ABC transporter substrate-binding protein [Micromonospora sp. KC213]
MSRFMIERRGTAVLAGVATAALALSACGVASTSSGGSAGELTLWTHNAGNPAELGVINQIVADYNASQSKYTVKLQAFPQESYNDAVVAAATAKKLPCVLDADAPTVPNWAYAGYLTPLDLPQDLVSKQLKSTLGNYQGKLYSIGMYDAALGLFARKSALEAAGVRIATVDNPWTAQEFADALAKIKADGKYQYAFDLGTGDSGTEWWTYGYSPFLQSFGGDLIDRNGYKTAGGVLNGDAALKWASWFQGLVKNGYTPAKSSTDAFADFVNGKSAMVWSGIWHSGNLSKLGADGIVMPPPDFGNGPKIGGGSWQWAVSSTCGEKAAAMDYITFSLNKKYLAEMAEKQNVIPATEEAAAMVDGWQPGGAKRFFLDESAKYAMIRPPTPGYPFLTTTFAKAAQDIIAGGDPKTILDQAVSDIDADLKANNHYGF